MKTDITQTQTEKKPAAGEVYKRSILHRRYIRSLRRETHGIGF